MKILVATDKAFAPVAIVKIREVVEAAGYELALLENYKTVPELLSAVSDADAMIVRSDLVTSEVLDAAKKLKIVIRAGAGYDNLDLSACTAHLTWPRCNPPELSLVHRFLSHAESVSLTAGPRT